MSEHSNEQRPSVSELTAQEAVAATAAATAPISPPETPAPVPTEPASPALEHTVPQAPATAGQGGEAPSPDAGAAWLATIADRLDACDRHLDELNRLGKERERVVDRLHEENQALKTRDRERAMLPLLKDLIRLYDDVSKTEREYHADDPVSRKAARDLGLYRAAAADILARQGIEPFLVEATDPFDAGRHRAIASVSTSHPMLDRRIARVVRVGFATDQQVIRAAEVEVYRLAEPSTAQEGPLQP